MGEKTTQVPRRTMWGINDVAMRLHVHQNTVRNLVSRGELKAYVIGRQYRFERADVEAYIASAATI